MLDRRIKNSESRRALLAGEYDAEIRSMRAKKISIEQIASLYEISEATCNQHMRTLGLTGRVALDTENKKLRDAKKAAKEAKLQQPKEFNHSWMSARDLTKTKAEPGKQKEKPARRPLTFYERSLLFDKAARKQL